MERMTKLTTEDYHPDSENLDLMSIAEIVQLMNEDDLKIPQAIAKVLPEIEQAIEAVIHALKNGGRLFYVGAGTSGRIGLLDAVECPPTFSTPPKLVQALLAGGSDAVMVAIEGAEDNCTLGKVELKKQQLSAQDVVIGIAASGRTPFVKGALVYAQQIGAQTISLASNPQSVISAYADIAIEVITGPEILTGSTRLKAATAHKQILNMITTTSMVKLGKVYKNLMVDVHASNFKLRERAKKIVCEATGVSYEKAENILEQTNFQVKLAIVMLLTKTTLNEAERLLAQSEGHVRTAVELKKD
ncbi:N-acetylmuramic acid 6-phosphate etherase [Lysinibacillus agricola]|uniref:N-acetylmuramic acid 6-phosphate etherase n=1 Tax=Lysinibacillus agricola TaxID=2590012 RepID=A0ABX7AXV2_9BACI|nr:MULTISPECIES: N-acetylmuramic acid 6-phosphate etherase [Lysinibacillus]KOS60548.1 N-acetylmuramic acid-6-phosphate etherase [Lysinibacillus sp. FJAT-14222]QQP14803.1 N-acetylmuramic acid 6-phosphate etherase [Lysinibacillus agricola]